MARRRNVARSSVSGTPDPLPHGATGSVVYDTRDDAPWCEVSLLVGGTDVTAVSFLDLFRGNVSYSFGPTPTWDSASGGTIRFRLFGYRNGVQRTLATGTGTYL
jgi:hypothetical protein